jgi:hypothetical protein
VEHAIEHNTFPNLQSFQTSKDMPLPLLLDFLSQHPKVSSLAITVNTYSKTMPMDDVIKRIDLKSLTIISGLFFLSCTLHLLPHPWQDYPCY